MAPFCSVLPVTQPNPSPSRPGVYPHPLGDREHAPIFQNIISQSPGSHDLIFSICEVELVLY